MIIIPFEETLSKFRIAKRRGNRIQAYCPTHHDDNASLSILVADDKLMLYCHAGCNIEDILKAARLTFSDLFSDKQSPVAIYQYRKKDGSLSHEKLKFPTAKGKRFTQRRIENNAIVENLDGVDRIPYNFPQVLEAIKQGSPIVYVEGEKDAETARLLGYIGTTMGGAADWRDEYKHYFKNASVVQIPDNDPAGLSLAKTVTQSLSTVCKSLKVCALPVGKDLSDWYQAGNSDLTALMTKSAELVHVKGIPEPAMEITTDAYHFSWNGLNLKIKLDRIKNDDEGEISVYENDAPIYISGIKLLSVSHKTGLARALKTQRNLDWDRILNQVATKSLAHLRQGEQIIWLDAEKGNQRPEYLIPPLFVKNAMNIIYADRSSAKSLFMILMSLVLSIPWHDNPLGLHVLPDIAHSLLFLDWENDDRLTGWQKECLVRGMDLPWCNIPYLRCSRSLVDSLEHVKSKITELGAEIIVIDSLGPAVGDDLNATKPAFSFLAALRQLPVTPLVVAHTSKNPLEKRKSVYGNAFYENEARSIWEISKQQERGSNELIITLHHRKPPPFAGYHEPMAWRFIFEGNRTMVEQCEPEADKREAAEAHTVEDKILGVLMLSDTPLTSPEILEKNKSIKEGSIRVTLSRMLTKKEPDIGRDNDGRYFYIP